MATRRDFLKSSVMLTASAAMPIQPPTGKRLRVAVIGAGAFGGWTALHLRRAGAEVTLVDAWGPGNARASSGGETRVIRAIYGPTRRYVEMASRALALWREWDRSRDRPYFQQTGVLWMTGPNVDYPKQALPLLRAHDLPCEEITPTAAAKRWPQINFEGITNVYFEAEAGYLLARLACDAVVRELVRMGGTYRQAAVTGVKTAGHSADVRLSDGSALKADRYVFACGPWLGRLFPDVIGVRLQVTRQEVFYYGAPAGDERFTDARLPVWVDIGARFMYGIPGNIHRGFKVADDTRGPEFDPTDGDRAPSASLERTSRAFLERRFPAMARAPLLGGEVCQYENSPDGHFLIDRHPAMPEVWLAGGGSGHGYKMGPALGELLARQVREDLEPDPLFALARLNAPRG